MPRPRSRSLFELGGQWIAANPGRAGLYRFWYDAGTGRTRRASLRTTDLETAKTRLAEIVVKGVHKTVDSYLSIVLEDYFVNRTDYLPSKKPARNAGRLFLDCWGELVKVSMIDEAKQKEFVDWSLGKGHSLAYVCRNMGVLAAALGRAKISVKVIYNEGEMLALWPLKPKARRKRFIPTDVELARMLGASMPEDLRRWLLNSMATGGRPEAVLELSPAARDRNAPLLNLNPDGRLQNKKWRACVRILPSQRRWLETWERADAKAKKPTGRYCRYASVDSIDTALERVCRQKDVCLPAMNVSAIRHKVTSVLRAAKVPGEQISYQLGHRRPDERTTRGYGEYDPGYLSDAAAALEAWIQRIIRMSKDKGKQTALRRAA